jgi:hypothetical protein
MNHAHSLESIPDEELLAGVQRLTARSNVALADLLAYLGEVELRGIHRTRACASLYTYCIYELRLSEDAAYRRSKAARFVREYPELRNAVAKGEIHLTGVLMIGPQLGGERHAEILQRARFRSKRELLRLVAELDPKPEVPTLVEPIGPERAGVASHRAQVEALAGPVRELPAGRRPEDWMEDAAVDSSEVPPEPLDLHVATNNEQPDTAGPERPLRYRVQFTASQEFVDLLTEACDLIGHETPRLGVPDIQLLAMRALVKQLRAQKCAATARPRSAKVVRGRESAATAAQDAAAPARKPFTANTPPTQAPSSANTAPARVLSTPDSEPAREPSAANTAPARVSAVADGAATPASRYIPAAVRRAVWDRDRARCAYHDDRGERCRETSALEIHHRHAHSLGGPPTLENLELRCRTHNTLAAEQDFGREHMDWMRGVSNRDAPVPRDPSI